MDALLKEKPNPTLLKKWGKRKNLMGPYSIEGRALYYDTVEGAFYDPSTDFFVDQNELSEILLSRLMA